MYTAKKLKICPEGHKFYKSSDCPTCPVCEDMKKPASGFLGQLSAPARRALENEGIKTLKQLSGYSEKEIRALHGMGPASIPILINTLKAEGLSLKTQNRAMSGQDNIDEYIKGFVPGIQKKLQQLRKTIQKAAPKAVEKISYAMPTFYQEGNLVHFAAYTQHIGFYPAPDAIKKFGTELSSFKSSKGAVQFPLDQPLPLELITRIVKFRVLQNTEKSGLKKNK